MLNVNTVIVRNGKKEGVRKKTSNIASSKEVSYKDTRLLKGKTINFKKSKNGSNMKQALSQDLWYCAKDETTLWKRNTVMYTYKIITIVGTKCPQSIDDNQL